MDTPSSTSGNDTYNANPGASNANTFTAFDVIDGGLGTDTLNVNEIGAAGGAAYALNTGATVRSIEVLNYVVSSDNVGDAVTADVSAFTGLTTVNVNIAGTDAPLTLLTTKGNVTTASVTGATTSAITDSATVDTLASVTVVDSTGLATLTSDALTSLTLKSSTGGATVTAAAATRGLTVNLDGVSAGTVTDAEATSLTVNASGTKSSGVTLTTAKATTVTLNAAVATTIADVNFAAGKTLTVTGAGATAITATTGVGVLTSIDASGSAGGLKVGAAIGTGVSFTGGAGADAVILAATTKAIVTGGGNDTVTLNAVAALGTGGSVDAGDGTADTLVFNTFANAVTASGATTFAPTVSNFERLEFSGANAANGAAINLANLDSINYVTLSATNTQDVTISNMGANGTIVFTADQTTGEGVVLSLANATGTTDVLNVGLSKATATALVSLTAAAIETVNVTSTETATTLLGTVTHGVELLAFADAKALNISGNAGVTVTTLTGTNFTSIDASGVTAGLVSFTTGALGSAASIKGGAAANTIVASAATKAVTYTGQEKVDTITISNAQNNVVNTGGGDDVIVVGSGANTVDAGAGADSITVGAGLNIVTGGAGNDILVISAYSANGNTYTTFDAAVGDRIDLSALTVVARVDGALGAKITLADTAAFSDYLSAATSTIIVDGAASLVKWFQFSGNTYLVVDDTLAANAPDDTNGFENGIDSVVKLVGLVDLTRSTTATDVLTIVV